jgi:hypothetical protein
MVPRISRRDLLLCSWIGLILFSSTSLAGQWADELYRSLFQAPGHFGYARIIAQKSVHVLLFGSLGWLVTWRAGAARPSLVRGAAWSFAVGIVSEGLQLVFETRHPAWTDVLLNGLSGSLGSWLCLWRL